VNALASATFWRGYNDLSGELQKTAKKQYALWAENHQHPSVEFKPVGRYWSARINDNIRTLGRMIDDDTIVWFWIGTHDEYMRKIRRKEQNVQS
jgi:hypothetical protein